MVFLGTKLTGRVPFRYTWPLAMQGRDVIGVAATGSGKTLAFLLLGTEGGGWSLQGPGRLQLPLVVV